MTDQNQKPTGDLTIRTVAMPSDTNPRGDIFGGWLMSQMDLAGGIMATRRAKARRKPKPVLIPMHGVWS